MAKDVPQRAKNEVYKASLHAQWLKMFRWWEKWEDSAVVWGMPTPPWVGGGTSYPTIPGWVGLPPPTGKFGQPALTCPKAFVTDLPAKSKVNALQIRAANAQCLKVFVADLPTTSNPRSMLYSHSQHSLPEGLRR